MLDNFAHTLATHYKSNYPEFLTKNLKIYEYGLKILLNIVAIIIFTTITSLVLGTFINSIIVLISIAILRLFSGGAHVKSNDLCVLISTSLILIIPFIHTWLGFMGFNNYAIVNIISFLLVSLFAPRSETRYTIQFKLVSIGIVLSNCLLIQSEIISLALFIQAISIIPFRRK